MNIKKNFQFFFAKFFIIKINSKLLLNKIIIQNVFPHANMFVGSNFYFIP